jgi:hypothetical protein
VSNKSETCANSKPTRTWTSGKGGRRNGIWQTDLNKEILFELPLTGLLREKPKK